VLLYNFIYLYYSVDSVGITFRGYQSSASWRTRLMCLCTFCKVLPYEWLV